MLNYSAIANSYTEKFHPLQSSMEFGINEGKAIINIISEVSFSGRLVNNQTWEKMTYKERTGGHVNIYNYKYTFTNSGTIRLQFTFARRDVLSSPLFSHAQALSIVLEPGQTKIIHFTANTTPQEISTVDLVMIGWSTEKAKWFPLGTGQSALYIPQWNAISEETP